MIDLSKNRICVTGGNGFLGRYIVNELLNQGNDKVIVPRSKTLNLKNSDNVRYLFDHWSFDIVIHAAANCGGIGLNQARPAELFYDNIIMGVQLMHEAYKNGIKKFVQLGTVCEYPKFAPVPFMESGLWSGYPEETNAPYGIAKKSLLVMGQAYRRQYGFNVIHLLPVNLYGPGDNFDPNSSHVIPALIRKFVEAKETNASEVVIWGSGSVSREFLYVEDAAKAIVSAVESYDKAEPINIGSGEEIKISHLAAMIADMVDYRGQITLDHSKPDGQPRRCLDTSKAFEEFGFKAETKLRDGLKRTVDWYKENRNGRSR